MVKTMRTPVTPPARREEVVPLRPACLKSVAAKKRTKSCATER